MLRGTDVRNLWPMFERKAEPLSMDVIHATDAAAAVASVRRRADHVVITDTGRRRLSRLAESIGPADGNPTPNVVTAGRFGIAETGSVAVAESRLDRRSCYLAEHLWIVLDSQSIVANLDQAFAKVAEAVRSGDPYLTFMSGPSRTADIERVLTIGVHGPRRVTVVVVDEADRPANDE